MRDDMGNPFNGKPTWKVRSLYSLSINIKWLRVQESMAYGLWDTEMHKSTFCALYPMFLSYFSHIWKKFT